MTLLITAVDLSLLFHIEGLALLLGEPLSLLHEDDEEDEASDTSGAKDEPGLTRNSIKQ